MADPKEFDFRENKERIKKLGDDMAALNLSDEDKQRLKKIDKILDGAHRSGIVASIRKHFNGAAIHQAFTLAESEEQMCAVYATVGEFAGFTPGSGTNGTLPSLKSTDIFMSVARRVASDKDLATLLPKKLNKKDAEVLEKCELKSLAALVRAKL